MGHGVSPPRVIYQPEPSFSEPARKAKYQGTMTTGLIVDKDGHPQNIHILSPLGAGLDAKAVKAVETWSFNPRKRTANRWRCRLRWRWTSTCIEAQDLAIRFEAET